MKKWLSIFSLHNRKNVAMLVYMNRVNKIICHTEDIQIIQISQTFCDQEPDFVYLFDALSSQSLLNY